MAHQRERKPAWELTTPRHTWRPRTKSRWLRGDGAQLDELVHLVSPLPAHRVEAPALRRNPMPPPTVQASTFGI